jgi:UPF0176 protein
MSKKDYYVLAFYLFTPIEDPHGEVRKHRKFFMDRDITSRIYISEQGINAQMSAAKDDAEAYMEWMKQDERFKGIDFKIHLYHEQAFPRANVRYKKQLVALDQEANPHEGGRHVSSEEWKKMLEEKNEDTIVIDVRNDYEWEIGHFEGALKPKLDTFRKFPQYVEDLKKEYNPEKTRVMMYCTGGIRCELYSALMKDKGFGDVCQLNGGVIRYGLEQGDDKWKGQLFVFDDRMAIPLDENNKDNIISSCFRCGVPCDVYFNCASMDCNELYLCCPRCAEELSGCCSEKCQHSPRVRAFEKEGRPKPFRRKHLCEVVS